DGTIASGAYAELVHLMRPGIPDKRSYRRASLAFCGAFSAHPTNKSRNILHVLGRLQPVARDEWWWTQAARLVIACARRDKIRARGRISRASDGILRARGSGRVRGDKK